MLARHWASRQYSELVTPTQLKAPRYYPFEGGQLFPGDSAPLSVPNQLGITHVFKLFQAQLLRACESQDLQLSWAVLAEL